MRETTPQPRCLACEKTVQGLLRGPLGCRWPTILVHRHPANSRAWQVRTSAVWIFGEILLRASKCTQSWPCTTARRDVLILGSMQDTASRGGNGAEMRGELAGPLQGGLFGAQKFRPKNPRGESLRTPQAKPNLFFSREIRAKSARKSARNPRGIRAGIRAKSARESARNAGREILASGQPPLSRHGLARLVRRKPMFGV